MDWLVPKDRKAIRIDSTKPFKVEITITPEFREKLRKAAKPGCAICLESGLYQNSGGEWTLCSCLEISS